MISYLTPEQVSALQAGGNAPMQIVDPTTRRVFYVIDSGLLAELERRSDLDAIREGVSDMQAGSSVPIDQARTTDRYFSIVGCRNSGRSVGLRLQ